MENELSKKVKESAKDNVLNLGIANGWDKDTNAFCRELKEVMIPNSRSSRNLGRCYNEYTFEVIFDDVIYKVIYSVDSSD